MKGLNFKIFILEIIGKAYEANKEYQFRVAELSDKIIVWLVGISLMGFGIVFSRENELNLFIPDFSKTITLTATYTIIFGVFYRILLYLFWTIQARINTEFISFIESQKRIPSSNFEREFEDNCTFEEIIKFIDYDFNKKKVNSKKVEINRLNINNKAEAFQLYYNEKFLFEKSELNDALKKYLGFSERRINGIYKTDKTRIYPILYWILLYVHKGFFILSCLTFLIGLMMISYGYMIRF